MATAALWLYGIAFEELKRQVVDVACYQMTTADTGSV